MKFHFMSSSHEQAQPRFEAMIARYGQHDLDDCDVIIVLGGDGQMLHALRQNLDLRKDVYGMNCGRVGFLMNDYQEEALEERIINATKARIHPLKLKAVDIKGQSHEALAFNEVSLLRQTHAAAHLEISINQQIEMEELVCDGVILATPQGSTAYNLSAHGPILPIRSNMLALTPISAYRPRRWRGALLPEKAEVSITALEAEKRPVSAVADHTEFRDVVEVTIKQSKKHEMLILFDSDHSLDERILAEQFSI